MRRSAADGRGFAAGAADPAAQLAELAGLAAEADDEVSVTVTGPAVVVRPRPGARRRTTTSCWRRGRSPSGSACSAWAHGLTLVTAAVPDRSRVGLDAASASVHWPLTCTPTDGEHRGQAGKGPRPRGTGRGDAAGNGAGRAPPDARSWSASAAWWRWRSSGATGWKLYSDSQREDEIAGTDLAAIGASASAAGCADITTSRADGSGRAPRRPADRLPRRPAGVRRALGQPRRPSAASSTPPTTDPRSKQLVHNLEHGYTILWYDETVADDDEQMQAVEDLATKFDVGNRQ